MLTSQQLAEARAHERRRIVTAFVSGSVPEQVAAPPSAARSLVAGLGLAVLLAAGAVVLDLTQQRAPTEVSARLSRVAEDRGFEPLRAVNPTRFPSERHRPLGESSAEEVTGR